MVASTGSAQPVSDALYAAATKGDLARIEELVTAGTAPESTSSTQDPAVMAAIRNGHRDVVRFMLERGGPAVITFAGDLLEAILQRSDDELADVWWREVRELQKQPNEEGYAAAVLNSEAAAGHRRGVDFLLAKEVAIDSPDVIGETPLISATRGRHADMVKHLIAKGADVERESIAGGTVLTIAVTEAGPEVIEAVLAAKPKVNRVTSEGKTALTLATRFAMEDTVERLLKQPGIDVNVAGRDGETPLMLASEVGSERTVALLIEAGADRRRKDARGRTAADLAAANNFGSIVRMLNASGSEERAAVINPAPPPPLRGAESDYLLPLLEEWIVRRNPKPLSSSLAKGFYSFSAGRYDNPADPPSINSKSSIRKLLEVPLTSDCISPRCTTLSECLATNAGAAPVEISLFRVDSNVTQFVPAAKDDIGKVLLQASFQFRCGLAVNIVFTRDEIPRRVISIEYGVSD